MKIFKDGQGKIVIDGEFNTIIYQDGVKSFEGFTEEELSKFIMQRMIFDVAPLPEKYNEITDSGK